MSLQKADVICITLDLWSNRQIQSFFGMTAHHVADRSIKSAMFACSRFHGSHTGDAISEQFEKIVASFEISNKVLFMITDSASNMMKAFSLPGFEEEDDDDSENDELEEDEFEKPALQQDDMIYMMTFMNTFHVSRTH